MHQEYGSRDATISIEQKFQQLFQLKFAQQAAENEIITNTI